MYRRKIVFQKGVWTKNLHQLPQLMGNCLRDTCLKNQEQAKWDRMRKIRGCIRTENENKLSFSPRIPRRI